MFVVILFFSGCNTSKTVTPVTKGIEFTLNVTAKESKYDITAVIDGGGCIEATVNSPETIKGMKITSNKFETLAEYKNLKYTYNEDEFSGDNYIITVYNILSSLENKKLSIESCENCSISDRYSGEKYDFTFSPAGLPIELNVESKNFKAVFSKTRLI